MEAIDKLWGVITELDRKCGPITLWFNIALPSEYIQIRSNPKTSSTFQSVTRERVMNWINEASALENYRPYLGEVLWQQFFLYRSILGRLGLMITQLKEGEEVQDWKEQKIIQEPLKALLDKSEYDEVITARFGSVTLALNFIQSKMLKEIDNILSGRQSSIDSLRNSLEIQKLMAKSNTLFDS
jgi:hypothetical protein